MEGAYGFQLSGSSDISGRPARSAVWAGWCLKAIAVRSAATRSVNFNGFFLGNPVTGSWEFQNDCTLTWTMQDDSGNFQHFKGTAHPGGARVDYVQTDKGSGSKGSLRKIAPTCSAAAFQGQYRFSMSGSTTPFAGGAPVTDSVRTTADADGAGKLTITRGEEKESAAYTVDSDCFVQIDFANYETAGNPGGRRQYGAGDADRPRARLHRDVRQK